MLCCPDCVLQYLDSERPPADIDEQERRAWEKRSRFFIGESKPWS